MWRPRRQRLIHEAAHGVTPRPLTELPIGQIAEIASIDSTRQNRLTQLSSFGLVPGSFIRLQQRRPAYIIMIGETEVTLDADIAREIMVRAE